MAPYEYTLLKSPTSQIRLLRLFPGLGRITCQLLTVSLIAYRQTYEPISYCWRKFENDRTEKSVAISIDGLDFFIGENLYDALTQMRLLTKTRTLWADAICINQKDPVEKSSQVSLMAQVYRNGLRTLVWLGQADQWTQTAFAAFKNNTRLSYGASQQLDRETSKVRSLTIANARGTKDRLLAWNQLLGKARREIRLHKAVYSVLGRQYFTRAWVIQEVVLSQHVLVLCGQHEMAWDDIYRWLDHLEHDFFGKSVFLHIFLRVHSLRAQSVQQSPCTLAKVMATMSPTRATDLRDKLYSVLGLVAHYSTATPITVDYTMDWESIFYDFTKRCLLTSTKLDVLCMGFGTGRRNPDGRQKINMPSWAWNPEPSFPYDRFTWDNPASSSAFRAAKESTSLLTFKDKLLGLHGYVWDTISTIRPMALVADHPTTLTGIFRVSAKSSQILTAYFECRALAGLDDTSASSAVVQRQLHMLNRTLDPYCYTDEAAGDNCTFEAFDNAMCRRFAGDVHRAEKWINIYAKAKLWTAPLLLSWQNANGDASAQLLAKFTPKEGGGLQGRRVVRTSRGFLGLCPKDTQKGDNIVLLRGSDVPFVFRQSANRSGWSLVGECFVHEVMYGEHWDETRCKMLWVE